MSNETDETDIGDAVCTWFASHCSFRMHGKRSSGRKVYGGNCAVCGARFAGQLQGRISRRACEGRFYGGQKPEGSV